VSISSRMNRTWSNGKTREMTGLRKFFTLATATALVAGCSSPQANFAQIYNDAVEAYANGDLDDSLVLMDSALEILPDSPEANKFVADVTKERKELQILNSGLEAQSDGDFEYAISRFLLIPEDSGAFTAANEEIIRSFNLWASATIESVQSSATTRKDFENAEALESLATWSIENLGQISGFREMGAFESHLTGKEKLTDTAFTYRQAQLLDYESKEMYVQAVGLLNQMIASGLYGIYNLGEARRLYEPLLAQKAADEANRLINEDRLEDAITPIQAALVVYPESASLKDAERQVEGFLRELYESSLAKMEVVEDDFDNLKFYYDRNTLSSYPGNHFFLYIGQKGEGAPYLRFQMMYYGNDWVFWERLRINVDGQIYEIEPGYFDVERDNYTSVWEWYDIEPSEQNLDMLRKVAGSEKTVLRFEGDYSADRTVTTAQKQAIKNVLYAYEALKQ